MQVVREFELDKISRDEWAEKASAALKYATQEAQPKTYPWPGASNIIFPLISQAALEFGQRTMPAVIPGRNVVKGIVWGDDAGKPLLVNGKPVPDPRTRDSLSGF